MKGASVLHVGLGVTVAVARPARAAAGAGGRVAAAGWRSRALAPARSPVESILLAAERTGAREAARFVAEAQRTSNELLERVVARILDGDALERIIAIAGAHQVGIRATDALLAGDGPARLLAHVVDQPALDDLVARIVGSEAFDERLTALLEDPALERLLERTLASRFADTATDQILASNELRRIVAHIAASAEVRAALQAQSAGLATEMADELRDRSTTVDDALERRARRLLRRRPRPAPVAEITDVPVVPGAPVTPVTP